MAMYDSFGPSRSEIGDAFKKAADEGKGYLLLLTETWDDPMLVTDNNYTCAVGSAEEIVPLLRKEQREKSYAIMSLSRVFDLSGKFEAQLALSQEDQIRKLPVFVQNALADYKQERKLLRAQQEWAQRPWYEKIFVSKPL